MLCGVWCAMWLGGRVPVFARRTEWLGFIRVADAKLVEVPTVLARAESLHEEVYRDPVGIFSEGRKTDGVTGCIDQRHIERRRGRRHWRSPLSGDRSRTLSTRHRRSGCSSRHGGAVLSGRRERSWYGQACPEQRSDYESPCGREHAARVHRNLPSETRCPSRRHRVRIRLCKSGAMWTNRERQIERATGGVYCPAMSPQPNG